MAGGGDLRVALIGPRWRVGRSAARRQPAGPIEGVAVRLQLVDVAVRRLHRQTKLGQQKPGKNKPNHSARCNENRRNPPWKPTGEYLSVGQGESRVIDEDPLRMRVGGQRGVDVAGVFHAGQGHGVGGRRQARRRLHLSPSRTTKSRNEQKGTNERRSGGGRGRGLRGGRCGSGRRGGRPAPSAEPEARRRPASEGSAAADSSSRRTAARPRPATRPAVSASPSTATARRAAPSTATPPSVSCKKEN